MIIGDILQCPLSTDITLKLAGIYRNRCSTPGVKIVYKKISTNEWYWEEENTYTRKLLLEKNTMELEHWTRRMAAPSQRRVDGAGALNSEDSSNGCLVPRPQQTTTTVLLQILLLYRFPFPVPGYEGRHFYSISLDLNVVLVKINLKQGQEGVRCGG